MVPGVMCVEPRAGRCSEIPGFHTCKIFRERPSAAPDSTSADRIPPFRGTSPGDSLPRTATRPGEGTSVKSYRGCRLLIIQRSHQWKIWQGHSVLIWDTGRNQGPGLVGMTIIFRFPVPITKTFFLWTARSQGRLHHRRTRHQSRQI